MYPFSKIIFSLLLLFSFRLSGQGLFEQSLSQNDSSQNNLLHINGFVRTDGYLSKITEGNDFYFQSLYSQLGLITEVNAGKFGNAYAEFRFRTGTEFSSKIQNIELREAYTALYHGPLSIKAGKQIITWGASSFINPTDQFSPQDPTYRSPDNDDLHLASRALNTRFEITSNSYFQLIWIPVYTPSVLITKALRFPEYIEFGKDIEPGMQIREGNVGFRYDLRSKVMDVQLSYFKGYRNTRSIKSDTAIFNFTSLQPDLIRLVKVPYRINSAGINLVIPFGRSLFRTEAAWMEPVKSNSHPDPSPELAYTAEIEHSGQHITLIAGYYGKYIFSFKKLDYNPQGLTGEFPDLSSIIPENSPFDPSYVTAYFDTQLSGFNRLYNYQDKEFYHSAYAILKISMFHELLNMEIPSMYNFSTDELTLIPSLKFNITDGLSFKIGVYYMHGGINSLYDLIGPELNAGYGQLKILF